MSTDISKSFLSAASQETFRLLLEDAPDSILLCDSKGVIQFVNQQTLYMLGYQKAELLGQSIDVLVPDAVRPGHEKMRGSYTQAPHKRPMGAGLNLSARKKDGTLVPVEISLSPVTISNEPCVLAIVRDVSQLRKLTRDLQTNLEELKRSNAELEQFAYVASHDLQEPLRMISGYTQLLLKRYGDKLDDDARVFIDFAVDGAKRMQNLINDLLSYSRLHTRKQPDVDINLDTTVQQALKNLTVTITESGATVKVDQLPTVKGDPVQMTQLFQNLISNAIKFRRPGTPAEVVITSRPAPHSKGKKVEISVRDNGIGINPQYAEKIFAIFQRLHSRDEFPGTGIGLAICKKIVEKHGGRIWVEPVPESEGHGSVFHFTLKSGE